MPNIRSALGVLAGKLKSKAGESVTYTRGGSSASVTAIIGFRSSREEQQGDARFIPAGEPMDFLIDPADLIIAGSTVKPARGDLITWEGRTYDVQPWDNEPESRASDPFEHLTRIHTLRRS